ncbi:MAG: hypothetical protein HY803_16670 [candidate division NC10 bacterium]|nr:hypothetical protein [candidate division NC10 bacterium]
MDLIAIKVTAASVAMVLAILQALVMAQLYGKARIFPLSPDTLAVWHRRQGDVILILFLVVAYQCVTKASVDWDDWRPVAHATFASLAVLLVVGKLFMVQAFPRAMRFVTAVGITLFISAMGATGTTVFWYLYLWLVRGIRPSY